MSNRAPASSPTAGTGTTASLPLAGYLHERRRQRAAASRGEDPGALLPAVHRIASPAKRWLLGTHQGSVNEAHLPAYLNEFTFRFNRRRSRSRGLVCYRVLELAAGHDPVRYSDIIAARKPRNQLPLRRGAGHPPSLERPPARRPWRAAEMQLQLPLRLTAYPRSVLSAAERSAAHPYRRSSWKNSSMACSWPERTTSS